MLYRVFPDAHRLRHCAQLGRSRSAATLSVPETEQSVPRTLARCICRLAVDSSFFKQSFPPINSRISQVNAFDSEELRCVSFNAPCKHICPQCTSRTESGVLLDVAECAKRPPSALVP